MKAFFFVIALTLSLLGSDIAKELNYHTDYETALDAALKADKPLMLVQVTDYCPWCRKLEKNTLSDEGVKKIVSEKFIPLLVLRDKSSFPAKFRTPRIPTIFFIEAKTEEGYWESIAYVKKDEMLSNLKTAL